MPIHPKVAGLPEREIYKKCATKGLEMAVLMEIKDDAEMVIEPWSFRNLFANIEGSLRRMAEVRIEVTNRGKNRMAKALAKA
ncbi:hypothetical protein Gohar_025721, partial [Gossypium harknessii]|nr:hypothetical protein [Gossypium harknessii]